MEIKTITVKRTFNIGNYQSRSIEHTAELGDNDDPNGSTRFLIQEIEQLGRCNEVEAIQDQIESLKRERTELILEIKSLRESVLQNQSAHISELASEETDLEEFL